MEQEFRHCQIYYERGPVYHKPHSQSGIYVHTLGIHINVELPAMLHCMCTCMNIYIVGIPL